MSDLQAVSFTDYTPPARFDGVPWKYADIEEGASVTGSWTLIDTIIFDVPDPDPADPQERDFTTTNGTASDLWYRFRFRDDHGNVTTWTAPVQNTTAASGSSAFADHGDLATWLGLDDMTDEENERADRLLADASNIIREEVKRGALGLVTDETISMDGTSDETILLPSTPVVSVSAVTLDSEPLTEGDDWYLDGNMIVRMPATVAVLSGINEETFPFGSGFGSPQQTLEITYTHGYPEIPGKVKTICISMVVRVWTNPGSVARETVGDSTVTYDNQRFSPTGMQLTDDERKSLKRLFGAPAKSVPIGR